MSDKDDTPPDLDALLCDARKRLARWEIEGHRIRAAVARLEALAEEIAADELSRLLADNPDGLSLAIALASYGGPAAQTLHTTEPLVARRDAPPVSRTGSPTDVRPGVTTAEPEHVPSPGRPAGESIDVARDRAAPRRRSTRARRHHPARRRHAVHGRRKALWPWRRIPAWATSVVVHIFILIILSLVTFAVFREPEPRLTATFGEVSETDIVDLEAVEIVPQEVVLQNPQPQLLEAAPAEAESLAPPQLGEQAEKLPAGGPLEADFAEVPLGSSALLEASGEGQSQGAGGEGTSEQGATSFFGAKSRANRIVFVLDNSNSMDDGRFATALMELARSVDALSPEQSFYVVLYSDTVYRLFHPHSAADLVPATHENKRRVRQWLGTAEMCTGGQLVDAMEIVADLEPEVVYLLSDGVISDYPVSYLTDQERWNFVIHTIGMTVPDARAAQNLLAIAKAHGGAFRAVGVAPLARELSRRRPVKKNRTRGPVWGTDLPPAE
jgi:hypothetical protein